MSANEDWSDYMDAEKDTRMAGYYLPGVDPDEDMPANIVYVDLDSNTVEWVKPHPHAAQPGAMPSVADLVAELATVRALLRRFSDTVMVHYPKEGGGAHCNYCKKPIRLTALPPMVTLQHAAACPWRQAAEYIARIDGQGETK